MKKVAFYTLGCKVNQYETEAISGLFQKECYEVVGFDEKADVYVINTCTVTNLSDRKSRQVIRRAKNNNSNSIVVVMGCYAQTAPEEVSGIPGVNLVIGTKERNKIIEYIKDIENGSEKLNLVSSIMNIRDFEELNVESYKERTRAFLKIQEGCSQFCAYCIIPYARGPIRSRQPKDIINEVDKLAASGFKEIVLTGIHVSSYGKDIKNTSLIDIIKKVHEIKGIERIRLGSLEPTIIDKDFVNEIKDMEKLCPHFHISLQSGCNETLKRMNRKYSSGQYRNVVDLLRANIKDVALTTDVMVGFPGETDIEFEDTYAFLKEIAFSQMHIFKFSPRKGTPAASFNGQVASEIKEERSSRLLKLSLGNMLEFNSKYVGRVMPVLFEQDVKRTIGWLEGLTTNYIRVLCKGGGELKGKIKDVEIERAIEDYVIGGITE